MGMFSNDEQASWSDVYDASKRAKKAEEQVKDLLETITTMTNFAAVPGEDIRVGLNHVYEVGKKKLDEFKKE